jgi:hypothetical protein
VAFLDSLFLSLQHHFIHFMEVLTTMSSTVVFKALKDEIKTCISSIPHKGGQFDPSSKLAMAQHPLTESGVVKLMLEEAHKIFRRTRREL